MYLGNITQMCGISTTYFHERKQSRNIQRIISPEIFTRVKKSNKSFKSTERFNSIFLNYHSSSFTNFCCGKKSEMPSENIPSKWNNVIHLCFNVLKYTMLMCSNSGARRIKVLATSQAFHLSVHMPCKVRF